MHMRDEMLIRSKERSNRMEVMPSIILLKEGMVRIGEDFEEDVEEEEWVKFEVRSYAIIVYSQDIWPRIVITHAPLAIIVARFIMSLRTA